MRACLPKAGMVFDPSVAGQVALYTPEKVLMCLFP